MTDPHAVQPAVTDGQRRSIFSPVAAIMLAVLVIIASTGAVMALRGDDPGGDSVEAGFLRDMVTHHGQAVEMSLIVYRRTTSEDMVTMTYDMATTQQAQNGMMIATLDLWDLSQTGSEPAMSWMGHPTTGLMPGMATSGQVESLRTLPPDQADVLLLQLMIVHHRAGVDMANALLERSDNDDARRLAMAFSRSQETEIANMDAMLVDRGQPTVDGTSVPAMSGMEGMDTAPAATPEHPGHSG